MLTLSKILRITTKDVSQRIFGRDYDVTSINHAKPMYCCNTSSRQALVSSRVHAYIHYTHWYPCLCGCVCVCRWLQTWLDLYSPSCLVPVPGPWPNAIVALLNVRCCVIKCIVGCRAHAVNHWHCAHAINDRRDLACMCRYRQPPTPPPPHVFQI